MNFKNKKFFAAGMVVSAILVFMANVSSVWAAGCGENAKQSYFLSVFNPLISFAQKIVEGFGYDVVLAASPDPDLCGTCLSSDSVGCSGATPTATMNWEAAPNVIIGSVYLDYYILSVGGSGYNVGLNTSYTVSGLTTGTTYNWSVEAYYNNGPSAGWGVTNQPCGSFTALNCTPTCPAGSVSLNPSSINVGQTSTASAPSGWSSGSFSSSNNSIATVSGSTITGQSQGSVIISGSNWTASNGAANCNLNGAPLTVSPTPKSHIVLSPTSFTFTGVSGGATPAGQTLNISNTGSATLNWTGSTNQNWCHLSSGSGSISAGGNSNVTVSVGAPSNVGSFTCAITISDANADNSPQTASVVYTVGSPCHCSRCSVVNDRMWVEFNTTDSTCVSPAGFPVTQTLNCTCRAGDASWYNTNYPGVCR